MNSAEDTAINNEIIVAPKAFSYRERISFLKKNFRFLHIYLFAFTIVGRYALYFILSLLLPKAIKTPLRKRMDRKNGERVKRLILQKQGLFIKAGQFSHLFRPLLTEEFLLPLEQLQDRVTPQPFALIERQLKKAFGPNYSERFVRFEQHAIAAASIGQVHIAYIQREEQPQEKVAVKVLYPYINDLLKLDLKSLKWIFRTIKLILPSFQNKAIHQQISAIVLKEIDLTHEARNLSRIKENFAAENQIVIPETYPEYSSRFILTTAFLEGVKITDVAGLERIGIAGEEAADLLIWAYANQIFQHRFFHADPHPGNIMILPNHKIGLIDFGACEALPVYSRDAFRKIIRSAMAKDYYKVIEGMEELGAVPKTADLNILETTVSYAVEKIRRLEREQRTWNDMSFEELSGIEDYRYLRKFNIGLNDLMSTFTIPQGWVALERVVGHLMAIITRIAPHKTMGQVAKPYLSKLILDDYEGLKELFNKQSRTFAHNIADLPYSANRLMNHFLRGRGTVSVHGLEKSMSEHIAGQRQLVWSFFTIFAGSVSLISYLNHLDLLFFNSIMLSLFGLLGTLRAPLVRKKNKGKSSF